MFPVTMRNRTIMTDILVTDATIITMDGERRVIERGAVATVDEAAVLAAAARATEIMIEASGLHALLETPEGFWRRCKYPERG